MDSSLAILNSINYSDDIDSTIIECVENILFKDNNCYDALIESINIIPEIEEYRTLIESATEIKAVQQEISSNKINKNAPVEDKISAIDKILTPFKKLIDWWYKVDPEKKYKTMHIILKCAIDILILVVSNRIASKLTITKEIGKRLPIGYEGSNKLMNKLFSRESIASGMVSSVVLMIKNFLKGIDDHIEYKVNKKDLDKNIKIFNASVETLNDLIYDCEDPITKKDLMKKKSNIEMALSKLIKMKEKYEG